MWIIFWRAKACQEAEENLVLKHIPFILLLCINKEVTHIYLWVPMTPFVIYAKWEHLETRVAIYFILQHFFHKSSRAKTQLDVIQLIGRFSFSHSKQYFKSLCSKLLAFCEAVFWNLKWRRVKKNDVRMREWREALR